MEPKRHPRFGGRQKGSQNKRTKAALEIIESLGFHPAEFLAKCALTGKMPNPDGTTTEIGPEERLKAAQALCPFVMPRLQSTALTGPEGEGPVRLNEATFDVTAILMNPELARAAQDLVVKMVEQDRIHKQLPEPPTRLLYDR